MDRFDAGILELLLDVKDSDGHEQHLDIWDIGFTAYYPDDINNLDLYEAIGPFDKSKMEIAVYCNLYGKSSPEIVIVHDSNKNANIKNCLIEVSSSHGM